MCFSRLHVDLRHLVGAVASACLALSCLSTALIAQKVGETIPQIVTTGGLQFSNCLIKRVDADGLFVFHSKGAAKIKFADLPPEWGEKFGFNEKAAAEFEKADALKQRELGLGASARQHIEAGKVTGRFDLQYPKPLNLALAELFRSTHITTGTGTAVILRQESRTVPRMNALGGQGLPETVTSTVEETKNLGAFLIVGNEADFNDASNQDRPIFPIDQSNVFFKLDGPIYAFSAESAIAASVALADIGRKRRVPFTEKRLIGQALEAAMAQYDPFMRTVLAVREGRLIDRTGASDHDPIALVTLDLSPRNLLTCCLVNDERIDTVLYQTAGDGPALSEEEILGILDHSTGLAFEEIVPHGKLEVVDDSGALVIEDWLGKTGATKAFWSADGKLLVVALPAPNGSGGYHAIWVTSRLGNLLPEIKAKTPREFWWSQVGGALAEFPPTIYETTFSGETGIESY